MYRSRKDAIREDAFHAITGLNAHLSLLDGHKDQNAFVFPLFPDSPGIIQAVSIVVVFGSPDVRHGHHHHRDPGLLEQCPCYLGNFLAVRRRNDMGEVIDQTLRLWDRAFGPH